MGPGVREGVGAERGLRDHLRELVGAEFAKMWRGTWVKTSVGGV